MSTAVKGFRTSQKILEQVDGYTDEQSQDKPVYVTVNNLGSGKVGLDVLTRSLYNVNGDGATDAAEAGSTDRVLVATGHGAAVGDVIRITSGANANLEAPVLSVPDANTIILGIKLPSAISAADTFELHRQTVLVADSTGALTVNTGPVQFTQDGSTVTVTEDTGTPANNIPLPVKLTDITGDINITANDLNVQLSHIGANADSTRIGDGTNELGITANNEALTQPNGNVAHHAADSGNPIKVGGVYNAASPTLDSGDRSDLQVDVNGNLKVADVTVASSAGVFAEDSPHTSTDDGQHVLSVRQDVLASSTSLDGDYASLKSNSKGELYVKDTDAATSLVDIETNTDSLAVVGGGVEATALRVTIASDSTGVLTVDQATHDSLNLNANMQVGDADVANGNPVPVSDAGGSLTVDQLAEKAADSASGTTDVGLALLSVRQDTLSSITSTDGDYAQIKSNNLGQVYVKEPNIPSIGQQSSAASMSVVLASDSGDLPTKIKGQTTPHIVRNDYSSVNVTTAAYTQLIASTSADINRVSIFDSSGETLVLALGAAASEVDELYIFPGGNGSEEWFIPSGSRLSVKAISANATVGELVINCFA